ncbi:hypothetical protein D3C84_1209680 [compost metagenome]
MGQCRENDGATADFVSLGVMGTHYRGEGIPFSADKTTQVRGIRRHLFRSRKIVQRGEKQVRLPVGPLCDEAKDFVV